MQSNKEKFAAEKTKSIIDEKIFSRSHLHTIYILFVNICKENDYKLTPSILYDLFHQLSQITNIKYEEYKIGIFHLQIDIDKDGIVNFEDFFKFVTTIMKFTYNEIYYKKGINLLSSLSLSEDRKLFIDIVSNLFSNIANYLGDKNSNSYNINNNLNPFTYYDYSLKFVPFYKFYCGYKNQINMSSYYNSQKKYKEFNEMLINYTNVGYITELQNLLNSQNTNEYYKGLSIFKKSIKPLNYINNELLIIIYNKNIFIFLTIILKANLLNKVLMIFNLINNKNNRIENNNIISPEVIYSFLVIIRRILNLYVFLNEIFSNCGDNDKKCINHFINEQTSDFKELSIFINTKILSPLSNSYNYFYEIFGIKTKNSQTIEAKIKNVMCQLILLTSKIKYEYYSYFITNTNYLEWLANDIKVNINIKNKSNIINGSNNIEKTNIIDFLAIENVVYNCINIIDITLRYENIFLNDNNNNNNNSILLRNNLYLKLLLLVNNIQELIFINNDKFSLLNENNFINSKNINNNDEHIPLKSKFLCLLGLLNCLNINKNNLEGNNLNIKEFDNSKFILQIYNEEFKTKHKELTLPFCFYLKSLIINNKQILSLIAGLDIINNFFIYFSSNPSSNYCSFSSFFDFCESILDYTDSKTLINNSNIISGLILIINKIISDNSNNNNLIDDMGIKNKVIELLSKITNLDNANLNEEILNDPFIFNTIILYMNNNFYYIEEMNYLNKKGIVFNILLIDNGLNIINNILNTNANSYLKILKQFNHQNLEILTNLFDKISLLWDVDDKNNTNLNEEILKNKYVFDKYKDIPKKNILIQILEIYDNLLDYKEKYQIQNKIYEPIFKYINDIDLNMRLKLRELKINSDGIKNFPTLILSTQSEQEMREQMISEFEFEIEGLTFLTFHNYIKNAYQSDLEASYKIKKNNNIVERTIKNENDFEVFIQELMEEYSNQPNKDNIIYVNMTVKLKEKKQKVKINCINCQKEVEVELNIDEKKFEELNDLTKAENMNNLNKIINESNQFCKDCQKYILETAKNQINIEKSKNIINNLSGINLSNLNINEGQGNNTYQNILANNKLNELRNKYLFDNLNNTSILSSALFNRTMNPGIGFNNNLNNTNQNSNLFGLNGINNISTISPMTPRRDNTVIGNSLNNNPNNINNTLSSIMPNYRIVNTKLFE